MGPEIEIIYIKGKTRNKINDFPHSSKAFLIDLCGTTNTACHACRALETQTGLWEKDWLQNSEAEKKTSWTRCAESRTLALHPLSTRLRAAGQHRSRKAMSLGTRSHPRCCSSLRPSSVLFFQQTGGAEIPF